MNVHELTMELMRIPSPSGEEGRIGIFLREFLEALGWTVELQPVPGAQPNVIARRVASPSLFLSTHMDTVPPYIPPTEDGDRIRGRGACDAKGILAAQIVAAEQLYGAGIDDVGLLFTVDEERGSAGARVANGHPLAKGCRFLINGEPTDNELAVGSKGTLRVRIRTTGRAAHSAYPEEGESATEKLLDLLQRLREASFPEDPFFGRTTLNLATLEGGVAMNVIPAKAEAGVSIRLTTDVEPVRRILEEVVGTEGELEILGYSLPMKFLPVEGFRQKVVRFTTDLPYLSNWGQPLLIGPGSILVAHTRDEFVLKKDLEEAVRVYGELARTLLGRGSGDS